MNLKMLRDFFGLCANEKGERDEDAISKKRMAFINTKIWDQPVTSFVHNRVKLPDQAKEYQGKFPIIFLTFSTSTPSSDDKKSFNDAIKIISNSIMNAFQDHRYLLEKKVDNLLEAINFVLKEPDIEIINKSNLESKIKILEDLVDRFPFLRESSDKEYSKFKSLYDGSTDIVDLENSLEKLIKSCIIILKNKLLF